MYVKRVLLLSALIFVIFSAVSCRKKTDVVSCTNTDLYLYGAGFDWTDVESGMLYTYKQDNAFDSVIDSARISAYTLDGDTSTLAVMPAGFDYKIVMPVIGRVYLVSGITRTGQVTKAFTYTDGPVHHEPFVCYNEVVSCNINGVLYSASNTDPNYPRDVAYLSK